MEVTTTADSTDGYFTENGCATTGSTLSIGASGTRGAPLDYVVGKTGGASSNIAALHTVRITTGNSMTLEDDLSINGGTLDIQGTLNADLSISMTGGIFDLNGGSFLITSNNEVLDGDSSSRIDLAGDMAVSSSSGHAITSSGSLNVGTVGLTTGAAVSNAATLRIEAGAVAGFNGDFRPHDVLVNGIPDDLDCSGCNLDELDFNADAIMTISGTASITDVITTGDSASGFDLGDSADLSMDTLSGPLTVISSSQSTLTLTTGTLNLPTGSSITTRAPLTLESGDADIAGEVTLDIGQDSPITISATALDLTINELALTDIAKESDNAESITVQLLVLDYTPGDGDSIVWAGESLIVNNVTCESTLVAFSFVDGIAAITFPGECSDIIAEGGGAFWIIMAIVGVAVVGAAGFVVVKRQGASSADKPDEEADPLNLDTASETVKPSRKERLKGGLKKVGAKAGAAFKAVKSSASGLASPPPPVAEDGDAQTAAAPKKKAAGKKKKDRTVGNAIDDLVKEFSVKDLNVYTQKLLESGNKEAALALALRVEESAVGGDTDDYVIAVDNLGAALSATGNTEAVKDVKKARRVTLAAGEKKVKESALKGDAVSKVQVKFKSNVLQRATVKLTGPPPIVAQSKKGKSGRKGPPGGRDRAASGDKAGGQRRPSGDKKGGRRPSGDKNGGRRPSGDKAAGKSGRKGPPRKKTATDDDLWTAEMLRKTVAVNEAPVEGFMAYHEGLNK